MKRFMISAVAVAVMAASVMAASKGGSKSGGSGGNNGGSNGSNNSARSLTLPKGTGIGNSNSNSNSNGNGSGNTIKKIDTKVTDQNSKQLDKQFDSKKLDSKVLDNKKFDNKQFDNKKYDFCGTKCNFGYCFTGFNHCHWSFCCWLPQYGCSCNYCPTTLCYYYWCVPDGCWYPVSYCPYGKFVW